MVCKHCGTKGPAIYWDGEAWHCGICGWLGYPAAAQLDQHLDCNMQFSVNCGSIVSERTGGKMRVRTWICASRTMTTSPWHAYQEQVGHQMVYFTHADSFDNGYQKHQRLKQEHYASNGWQQNLRAGDGYYRDRVISALTIPSSTRSRKVEGFYE
jgi:hypothetical protein